MKSILVHLSFMAALVLCPFTVFITQASSPNYETLWRSAAVLAGIQTAMSVGSGLFLNLKPRLLLTAATFLTLLALLEMTLRVWFRIRLI